MCDMPPSGNNAPRAVTLELDWTDMQGRQQASDWLLAEAWWADICLPPSIWQLLAWAPQALPTIIAIHLFSRLQDEPFRNRWHLLLLKARTGLYAAAAVLAAVLGLPVLYLLVIGAGAAAILPWRWLAAKAQDVRSLLTRVIGDAFLLAGSTTQHAAMLGRIERNLKWLSERCNSVVVVGHSQGAMLAYLTCRQRPPNVRTLITLGSGIGKLRALSGALKENDPVHQRATGVPLVGQLAGVGMWLAAGLGFAGQISVVTAICTALVAALAAVGIGLVPFGVFVGDALHGSPEDDIWDRWTQLGDVSLDSLDPMQAFISVASGFVPGGMVWLDLAATHDP